MTRVLFIFYNASTSTSRKHCYIQWSPTWKSRIYFSYCSRIWKECIFRIILIDVQGYFSTTTYRNNFLYEYWIYFSYGIFIWKRFCLYQINVFFSNSNSLQAIRSHSFVFQVIERLFSKFYEWMNNVIKTILGKFLLLPSRWAIKT